MFLRRLVANFRVKTINAIEWPEYKRHTERNQKKTNKQKNKDPNKCFRGKKKILHFFVALEFFA